MLFSGLQTGLAPGWLPGWPPYPIIDPNVGFTTQALGHRAAVDLFSGRMPWWNYFEGVGSPLAGEMQSAALFPLTTLMLIPRGQLYTGLLLQIISGLATFFVMKRLGTSTLAASAAGALFEFNGTFSWLNFAILNVIPFLPVVLLGVETTRRAVIGQRRGGWVWISVGVALSLYAGFPEVAYLDGLLITCWTLVRIAGLPAGLRVHFLLRVAGAVATGLLLAAPILIAFFDYLPHADVGIHSGSALREEHLGAEYLTNLFFPYLFGLISEPSNPDNSAFWGKVGGYSGVVTVVLAVASLFGSRLRALRLMLAAWVAVTWAASYGFPGAGRLVSLVPGVGISAFFRYLPPSWEFALAVLAGFALDDQARSLLPQPRLNIMLGMAAVVAMILAASYLSARHIFEATHPIWFQLSLAFTASLGFLLALGTIWTLSGRKRSAMLAGLATVEALALFVLPTFSNPKAGKLEIGGVRFLQQHLGNQRFYTLGPIEPNYGSYYGIPQINHNDVPAPADWTSFVVRELDDNLRAPVLFLADLRLRPDGHSAAENLRRNLANFLKIGVRYIVTPPPGSFPRWPAGLDGPVRVFSDDVLDIYELKRWRPYFTADGCRIEAVSREVLTTDCPAPSRLVRLELFMPGWQATVNDESTAIEKVDGLFQGIELPPGHAKVEYKFRPPLMGIGYLAFAVAGLVLAVEGFRRWHGASRRMPRYRWRKGNRA